MVAVSLTDIATPAALVDEARMMRNIARMQSRMATHGVRLRPHVKTPKCIEVARRQQAAGACGVTVSTLKEAEEFFGAGFADVLYAVCIAPQKLDRVLALRRRGCALSILVDSVAAAQAVVDKGRAEQHAFDVMIEVDTDGHRSGVKPGDAILLDIGAVLHQGGAMLKGVMTHAGSSYALNTPEALQAMAEQERGGCVRAAERLRTAGLPCLEVSVGSTPTALSARHLDGVTEVRAGVYVFFDLVMVNVGVCAMQDVALSVLTTVIGHQPDKGWAIVDAGWMANEPRPRHPAAEGRLRLWRGLRRERSPAQRAGDGGGEPGARHRGPPRRYRRSGHRGRLSAWHAIAHSAQPRLRHGNAIRRLPRDRPGRRCARHMETIRWLVTLRRSILPPWRRRPLQQPSGPAVSSSCR